MVHLWIWRSWWGWDLWRVLLRCLRWSRAGRFENEFYNKTLKWIVYFQEKIDILERFWTDGGMNETEIEGCCLVGLEAKAVLS